MPANFLSRFKNSKSMLSQVSLVAGGTVVAQGLNILCTPILSRIYSPEDFGVMSVFVSVMSILVPLSSMRYYLSIALPKTKRYSDACIVLCFLLEIISTTLFFMIALLFGNRLLTLCGVKEIIPYKLLLPLGIFAYATYMLLTQWAIRCAIFGIIARTKISQSVTGNVVKFGMGLLGLKPLGLIIGTIFAYGGGITSLLKEMLKQGLPKSNKQDIKRAAVKYRGYPKYDVFAAFLNTAGTHLVPIMVFAYFGAKIAGFFSMANHLLVIPSVFVGEAIGQVFLQRASKARYDGGLGTLTLKIYKSLINLGMYPILVLAVFAPAVFRFVLGAEWFDAGVYSRLLAYFVLFSFCFTPISYVYGILGRQDLYMKLEVVYCIARIFAFWAGALSADPKIAVLCFSFAAGSVIIIRSYYALKIAGVTGKDFLTALLGESRRAVILILPVFAVWLLTNNIWISLAAALGMSWFYFRGLLSAYRQFDN